MTEHAIVLAGFEPDWAILYIEGERVAEGHRILPEELVTHTAEYVGREGNPAVQLESTHVEEDEADEYGEFQMPDTLDKLEERYPAAYARIS